MSEYKDMSELLEADSGAMRFFNSLPVSLQRKMYSSGVGCFEQLYASAGASGTLPERRAPIMSAQSSHECTGLIAQGGGKTLEEWSEYRNIEPFGAPKS
ncbi:MAG: hypothetical protein ACI4JW_02190 [Oscillospiraceae bacterium]